MTFSVGTNREVLKRRILVPVLILLAATTAFLGIFSNFAFAGLDGCGGKNDIGPYAYSSPRTIYVANPVRPKDDGATRKLNVHEAYGLFAYLVGYNGEGPRDNSGYLITPENVGDRSGGTVPMDKAESVRSFWWCWGGWVAISNANFIMSLASVVLSLASFVLSRAFDNHLFCSTANQQNCSINLVKSIGGTGNGDGILSALTNGLFLPLSVIVVLFSAISILYSLVKFQIRESVGKIVWVFLSYIVFMVLLLSPQMMARAPMYVTNLLSNCVVGAFTGQSTCLGETTATKNNLAGADAFCKTSASNAKPDDASLMISAMNCQIWKATYLETLAHSQFGMGLSALNVKGGKLKAKGNPEDLCVYNTTTNTTSSNGLTLSGGDHICNYMYYQLYLKSGNKSEGNGSVPPAGKLDKRWYRIIGPVSENSTAWSYYPDPGIYATGSAFVLLIIAFMLGYHFTILGITALMYLFLSILLIIFAPVFATLGLYPGKGKKIFLGWAEQLLGYWLKFAVIALFIMTLVTVLGSVLGGVDSPMMSFVVCLVLLKAMSSYRKEFVNLLGTVSLGGQQLTSGSKIAQKWKNRGNKAKQFGKRFAAGTVATAAANYKDNSANSNMSTRQKLALGSSIGDSLSHELRRGRGTVATAMQAYTRTRNKNQAEQKRQEEQQVEEHRQQNTGEAPTNQYGGLTQQQINARAEEVETNKQEVVNARDDYNRDVSNLNDVSKQFGHTVNSRLEVVAQMEVQAKQELAAAQKALKSNPSDEHLKYVAMEKQQRLKAIELLKGVEQDKATMYKMRTKRMLGTLSKEEMANYNKNIDKVVKRLNAKQADLEKFSKGNSAARTARYTAEADLDQKFGRYEQGFGKVETAYAKADDSFGKYRDATNAFDNSKLSQQKDMLIQERSEQTRRMEEAKQKLANGEYKGKKERKQLEEFIAAEEQIIEDLRRPEVFNEMAKSKHVHTFNNSKERSHIKNADPFKN